MRLSVIASLVALSASAVSATADKIVVFADSYTDDGNDYSNSQFPPSPPYYEGRFSNGPTWLEHVAKSVSVPVENHGYGGATTDNADVYSEFNGWTVPGLKQQVSTLKSNGTADSLYVIEIAYNDLNSIINPDQYKVVNKNLTYEKVGQNVVSAVKDIVTKYHAKEFAFFNVAPFDKWPVIKDADKPKAKKLIDDYNEYIESEIKKISTINAKFYDLHGWFLEKIANPAPLGLSVTNGPCVWGIGNTTACSDTDKHFFWDSYHPEAKVHKAWGEWAIDLFKNDYQIN
ncbi:SGNH hydrolase-type esterase domain-containing protein [Parasitella parasitica]|nr:SGNH hydrolase-type esterase domain-containing protein [Parasitella parasitica]